MIDEPKSNTESDTPVSYVIFRRLFFVLCIVFFIVVALFLLYYNGKSIYENGL